MAVVVDALARLENILADPAAAAREARRAGRRVVGWLPEDVPLELLHAAGAFPFGIVGQTGSISLSDSHLQVWACSLARSSLEMALSGQLDFLDGLVIPHICDTTRMLGGIWQVARPLPWLENFLLPRQVDRPSARKYLVGEIKRLALRLEELTGRRITEESLRESIMLYNRQRALLRSLFALHSENPAAIRLRHLYGAVLAALWLPVEEHASLVEDLLLQADREAAGGERFIRLVASGVTWQPLELLDLLEEAGATVVADDLQTGWRYCADDVPAGDPWEALAARQLSRIPGCAWESARNPRAPFLTRMVERAGARGVLFLHLKFCEPENYDYHYLQSALAARGIPALRLELDLQSQALGQTETRLQAFLEMLGGEL